MVETCIGQARRYPSRWLERQTLLFNSLAVEKIEHRSMMATGTQMAVDEQQG